MYMNIQPNKFTHVKISFFRINASKGRKTSWWKVKHSNRQCNCHLCVFNYNVNNYVPVTTYQYQYNTVTVLLSQWLSLGCVWFLHFFFIYYGRIYFSIIMERHVTILDLSSMICILGGYRFLTLNRLELIYYLDLYICLIEIGPTCTYNRRMWSSGPHAVSPSLSSSRF